MRSVSTPLNRCVLAICGFVLVAASAWLLASGLGLARFWPDAAPYLASRQGRVGAVASQANWLLPVLALASVLAIIGGLALLLMQVPRRVAASPMRLSDSEGLLLTTLDPEVLSQALSERAQGVPGVERCTVWVSGTLSHLQIQADASVSQECEIDWTVSTLRSRLQQDVSISLGYEPKQIDLLVRLERPTSSKVLRTASGQGSPKPTKDTDAA